MLGLLIVPSVIAAIPLSILLLVAMATETERKTDAPASKISTAFSFGFAAVLDVVAVFHGMKAVSSRAFPPLPLRPYWRLPATDSS